MSSRVRMLDEPGPFQRLAAAIDGDRELLGHLVYEQALTLSGGLSGLSGRMTDGELRTAALRLASTSLTILAELGMSSPALAIVQWGTTEADRLETQRVAS